ncbi:TetR/AcrR family transcriptional regulator [Humibacter ginsengisoli]
MPRPSRPLEPARSQRLLVVAGEAFAADGFEGASLNDILSRAGMGKSSFYHRFADKAALHDWVTRTMANAILTEIRVPALGTLSAASFRPELTALLSRFQALAAAQPELMNLGLMFHNSVDVSPQRAIAEVRSGVMKWISAALERGRAVGVVRSDLPPDLLSEWAIASLTTIDRWALTAAEPMPTRAATSTAAIDALWSLLAPPQVVVAQVAQRPRPRPDLPSHPHITEPPASSRNYGGGSAF